MPSYADQLAAMGYSAGDLKRSGFTAKEIATAAPDDSFRGGSLSIESKSLLRMTMMR
jgi:hypothetical protein